MVRICRVFLLAGLLSSFQSISLFAQTPDPSLQPVPIAPPPPQGSLPPIAVPRADPAPLPGTIPVVPPSPAFVADPLPAAVIPEQTYFPCGGFYGLFEIALLFPDLHGVLSGPVTVMGVPQTVALGSANLNTTGSPRFEVGYRLGEGVGAVALGYRNISTKGGGTIFNFDAAGDGFLSSVLNVNVLDLDYLSPGYCIAPEWFFSGRLGLRGGAAYYNNQVVGGIVQQEATNNFLGIGPHATVEVGRTLFLPGLAIDARLDGAVMFGSVSQSFSETVHLPGGGLVGDTTTFSHTQSVPVLTFDIGLTYTPPGALNWTRFGFGYQYENWWNIGSGGGSHGDLRINGLYFRGEFNF